MYFDVYMEMMYLVAMIGVVLVYGALSSPSFAKEKKERPSFVNCSYHTNIMYKEMDRERE